MLENLRRIRAAANVSRDIPVVHMGTSVEDFFLDVERDTRHGETLPNWHGELYLEFHRGTYTSHGELTYKSTSPHPNRHILRFHQERQQEERDSFARSRIRRHVGFVVQSQDIHLSLREDQRLMGEGLSQPM